MHSPTPTPPPPPPPPSSAQSFEGIVPPPPPPPLSPPSTHVKSNGNNSKNKKKTVSAHEQNNKMVQQLVDSIPSDDKSNSKALPKVSSQQKPGKKIGKKGKKGVNTANQVDKGDNSIVSTAQTPGAKKVNKQVNAKANTKAKPATNKQTKQPANKQAKPPTNKQTKPQANTKDSKKVNPPTNKQAKPQVKKPVGQNTNKKEKSLSPGPIGLDGLPINRPQIAYWGTPETEEMHDVQLPPQYQMNPTSLFAQNNQEAQQLPQPEENTSGPAPPIVNRVFAISVVRPTNQPAKAPNANTKKPKPKGSLPPQELLDTIKINQWDERFSKTLGKSNKNYFKPLVYWIAKVKKCNLIDQTDKDIKQQLVEIIQQAYKNKIVSKIDWKFQPIGNTLYLTHGQVFKIPKHIPKELRLPGFVPFNDSVKEIAAKTPPSTITYMRKPKKERASSISSSSHEDPSLPQRSPIASENEYLNILSLEKNNNVGHSRPSISFPTPTSTTTYQSNASSQIDNTKNTSNYQYQAALNSPSDSSVQIIQDDEGNESDGYMVPEVNAEIESPATKRKNNISSMSLKARKKARLERFNTGNDNNDQSAYLEDYANLNKISNKASFYDKNKPLVGTNTNLEKPFLRLTSEAKPQNIRPLGVLINSYKYVLDKYLKGASYQYLCDQFKSIRQDLKVQLVENPFSILVYSKHAEIALVNEDLGEFNQCQSSLVSLFEKNTELLKSGLYTQYCIFFILYKVMMNDFNSVLRLKCEALTQEYVQCELEKEQDATSEAEDKVVKNLGIDLNSMWIKICLQINEYILVNDYDKFFKLYKYMMHSSQGRSEVELKLICLFVEKCLLQKMRIKAFAFMVTCFRRLSLAFLVEALVFEDVETLTKFCENLKIVQLITWQKSEDGIDTSYIECKSVAGIAWARYEQSHRIDIKGQI